MPNLAELSPALEPRELSALGGFELGLLLNEIDHDAAAFTTTAVKAIKAQAQCETLLLHNPNDVEAKMNLRIHRATERAARLQLSALNRRQSRIQSILKSIIA
jgi:hypothetical protein